ncbi:filamentous hemagglutinin N-terminal domain-containing protein, partial [Polynucleobacter paneuropaeus]|nr:filamentous hemagglutinin N-terminal domain-containing protein [Polynucleobacter paneuropaeus]
MIIKKTARQYIHIELQNDVEKLLFILSKNTELLISFFHQYLENFSEHIRKKKIIREKFSFKNIKPKSVLGFFVLIAFQFQYVIAQPLNSLPTNGKVVAGAATISQTSAATNATMTVNQTSQRAVINWDSFNVGKNAAVNFVTPGANSSTLNRVTGASPSLIQGALSSNGQIILVNANGITFGRGAQVDAPGVVASTMDIANKDFMDGKSTFSGSGSGKIVNKGTISASSQDGFIALLAPEVQNQGYLLASKGGTVVMTAGEQITLNFQGKHLGGVNVDIATYKALVANKRVVEVNGGLVVMAAGAANQLMSSVIKNTGRVSASSVVNNGGEIEFVGNTVTQAGTVEANSTTGVGGQVNLVGNNITATSKSKTTATGATGGGQVNMGLAQTAVSGGTQVNAVTPSANTAAINQAIVKANATQAAQNNSLAQTVTVEQGASIDASATQSGNGGIIAIWSALKTNIAGSLKAIGGAVSGNGGFVETSSKGTVILAPNAIINTSASNGKAGTWLLDPIDLTIDAATANIISAALENNNVSIAVNGNVCPSLGSCTQNGSGSLTIASGTNILKATGSLSTLSLSSSGVFNLNANISGQNLNVIISSSIAYLNTGSSITANQVTVQAQSIYANGIINAQSGTTLGAAIQLLAQAIYVSGGLNTSTSSNTNTSNTTNTSVTYNGNIIRKEDLPTFLTSQNNPNGNIASGLDVVYTSSAANDSSASAQTNTNQTNIIHLNAVNDLTIYSSAQILANGTNGGQITLSAQQLNAQSGSLIQANGNNGPGGVIAISGNQFNLDGTIAANGNDGGLISINAGSGALSLTGTVQANGSNGRGGTVIATQASDIQVNSATIQANGKTDGGAITLIADTGSINFTSALIQTNGSNGRGGSIGISAQNNVTLSSTKVDAIGLNQGGTIKIGNDASNGTLPFALHTSLDANSAISANQLDPSSGNRNGGFIETSAQTVSLLAAINAGRGGIWLIDPVDLTINSAFASLIVTGLQNSDVIVSTTANACAGVSCSGSGTSGNIFITNSITTNTNNSLYIEASGAIVVSSGVNIWLNTSNNSSYTASTGTGSLFMGGVSVGSITSSNWNTSCTGCYANAVQGGAGGSNYSGINLGTSGAGSAAVNIQVGGDVVMAGQNATTSNGYAGITLYSGSKVYGRNVSLYGISSAGVGMQLNWGATAAIDVRATSSTGTLLMAGSSSYVDSGATGTSGLGVFVNGSILRAPTIQIIGLNTNASCVQNIACAGIGLGWYIVNAQTTNIYTNYLKLVSDKVVLGLSPVQVAFCDSGCGGGIGTSLGIDFSSYGASSAITFYYPGSGSSTTSVAAGNNYGNYLVLPTAPNFSSYRYSVGGAITVGANLSVNGPINIYSNATTLSGSLTTTNGSTGNILIQDTVSTDAGLTGSGAITLAGGAGLTINQLGNSTYGGAISGALSTFTKSGGGTLTLTGANTYTGVTTVNAGILTNAASTSTKTSGFVINNGGTYKISSTGGFPNNPTNGYTFVVNSGGTLDLNGVGWLDGGSTGYAIQLNGGTLANNSATAATVTMSYSPTIDIVLTNNSIIGGSGNITINGVISGAYSLTNSNTGVVTLGGANTYTGVTTVNAGILTNAASTSTKTSGFVINNGGTYKISSTGGFPNISTNGYTFVVNSGGTLDLNGVGWLDGGSTGYAIQLNGGTLANNSATAATVTMSYSPTRDIVLTNNSIIGGSGNITINGVISGAYSLTSSNTGVVTLGGANSYSGGTFIGPSSKIVVTNANALGGSSGGVVNIGSSGILDLQYAGTITLSSLVMATGSSISNTTTNSALTVSGTSTLLGTITTSGAQTYTGAVLVGGATTLNTTNAGVSFGSTVSSSVNLTEVIQFLGGGSYNFAGTAGTATGTATTFADGSSISYNSSTGVYTFVAGQSASTQYLVVGGGGGASRGVGGIYWGAGAGGGAVVTGNTALVAGNSYSVSVGAGGAGQTLGTALTITAAAGSAPATSTASSGYNGGNGGTSTFAAILAAGGLGSIANGAVGSASGNGNAGGRGTAYGITSTGCAAPGNCGAGGGGGAGGAGTASAAGVGVASTITGSSVTYGAGGCASNGTGCASGTLTTNIGAGAGDTGTSPSPSGSAGIVALSIPNAITTTSLTINAGTGAVSMVGNVTNINLAINSKSTSSSIAGVISGPASLTYNNGSGYTTIATPVLTLSNANTYSGGTTIIAGTVRAGNASAFGSGPATVGSVATSTATVDLAGYSMGNAMTLNGGGSTGAVINSSTTSPSTVSGAVTIGSAASLGGAGNLTFSNTVTDSGNGIAFVGTGNFTMNNAANAIGLIGTVSASAIGNLSITDNTALTIGSVSVNAVAYAGINSSGTVSISANSGSTSTAITSSQAITANSLSLTGTATTAATVVSLTGNLTINTGNLSITGNDSAAGSNIGINQTGTITDNSNGGNITFTSNNIINQTGAITLAANTSGIASYVTYDTTSGNKAANITGGNVTITAGSTSDVNYVAKSAGSGINPGTLSVPGYVLLDNTYGAASGAPSSGYITNANSGTLAGAITGVNVNLAITADKGITINGASMTGYYSVSMTAALTSQGPIAITGSGINYSVYSSTAGTMTASFNSVTINGYSTTGYAVQLAGAITAQTGITINGTGTTAASIASVGALTLGAGYFAGTLSSPSIISNLAGTSGSLMGALTGSALPTISSAALSGGYVPGTPAITAAALQSSTATSATYLVAFADGTYTKMVQVVLTASGGYVYATEAAAKYSTTQLATGSANNVLGGTTNLLSLWNGSGAGGIGTVTTMAVTTSPTVNGYGAANLVLSGAGFMSNAASGNITITANNTAAGGNAGIIQTGAITDNAVGSNITFTSNNIINQTGAISLVANTASTAVSVTYNTTSGNKSSTITTGALTVAAGTNSSAINYIVKSAGSAINPGTIGSS